MLRREKKKSEQMEEEKQTAKMSSLQDGRVHTRRKRNLSFFKFPCFSWDKMNVSYVTARVCVCV